MSIACKKTSCVSEPNRDYHSDYAHLSNSMLSLFRRNPRRYYETFVLRTRKPEPSTPEMVMGSLVHSLILEPETIGSEYHLIQTENRRTKAWKDGVELAESSGLTPSPIAWFDQAETMAAAVRANRYASVWLDREGVAEQSLRWIDEDTGIKCKCRPDWMTYFGDTRIVIDVKTTASLEDRSDAFEQAVWRYNYDQQAAFYRNGVAAVFEEDDVRFGWIVVSKDDPPIVNIYQVTPEVIDNAAVGVSLQLTRLRQCIELDDWHRDDEDTIKTLHLPRWKKGEWL